MLVYVGSRVWLGFAGRGVVGFGFRGFVKVV
jgi:hypothetical protein